MLGGGRAQSPVENRLLSSHTATPRGPSPIFLISPAFWSLWRARRTWVGENRVRLASARVDISISSVPLATANAYRVCHVARTEGGRVLGKLFCALPLADLTCPAFRASLLMAITAPSQLGGNAPAPRCPRGVFFFPSQLLCHRLSPEVCFITFASIYHPQRA